MKITHTLTRSLLLAAAFLAASALLSSCGGGSSNDATSVNTGAIKVFDKYTAPANLSDWQFLLSDGQTLTLNAGAVPYDLNSTLFSDYAFKFRAIYVPQGKQITYNADTTFDFPVGSVIMKTFYYPKAAASDPAFIGAQRIGHQTTQGESVDLTQNRLIETRVLVRQADGSWAGLPYVWNDDQKDAKLKTGGASVQVELVAADNTHEQFKYSVPNAQACQQCHATANAGGNAILPIGPKARNMNKSYQYNSGMKNQLVNLDELKLLASFSGVDNAPKNADWSDTSQTLPERARAYLDVNCAHCHSATGQALQSGLFLGFNVVNDVNASGKWGVCKKPLAYAGPGLPYQYDIQPGKPDESILAYRISHTDTEAVMPVIGRHVNHTEGDDMIRAWITQLSQAACQP
ncbi:MAG: SO2930 family diheme c-type cytochrome [Collimonas sp.]|uniref:SO2930 family diheme c-type cytochrome n=1 Tax=Collimonas sp. TaxID=1963772 RepID=UPI0032672D82